PTEYRPIYSGISGFGGKSDRILGSSISRPPLEKRFPYRRLRRFRSIPSNLRLIRTDISIHCFTYDLVQLLCFVIWASDITGRLLLLSVVCGAGWVQRLPSLTQQRWAALLQMASAVVEVILWCVAWLSVQRGAGAVSAPRLGFLWRLARLG